MEATQQFDFTTVYAQHAPYVRRLLVSRGVPAADLDDVVQEVFVAVHRQLPSFEGRSRLETWLHSVTWRVAANYHRRVEPRLDVGEPLAPSIAGAHEAGEVAGRRFHTLFGEVDEQHRDLLALHDIGGFSVSELSELTGNARATIRQRIERARAALGRRIWNALTSYDEQAWLARLAPWFEQRRQELPLSSPIAIDGNAFSSFGNLAIALWQGTSSVAAHEALMSLMVATAEASSDGLRFVSIIDPGASAPSREARQLNAWACAKLGPVTKAAAWVAESSRLTTLVAPIMNTCFFLAGVPVNIRFFDSVSPAASWLGQHGPNDEAQIVAHVELMRRCLSDSA